MRHEAISIPAYVVKAAELPALNYLVPAAVRPADVEWINRGTDQRLRPSSVQMLLRTIFDDHGSPSVARLHDSAGLRLRFFTVADRDAFAAAFAAARALESAQTRNLICGLFSGIEHASRAAAELVASGVSAEHISLVYKVGNDITEASTPPIGHTKASVAAAVAGGGIAGALFGVAVLSIPGIGPAAAAGPLAIAAFKSMAGLGAAIGATGGAIARMMSDEDVEGSLASVLEKQVRWGKVLVSVDVRSLGERGNAVRRILRRNAAASALRCLNEDALASSGQTSAALTVGSVGGVPMPGAKVPAGALLPC
jgi:hypothetical protein